MSAPHLHSSYLLDKIGSNTVFITNPEGGAVRGSATGFEVIAPSGKVYTLTNAHVCELQKDGYVMVGEKLNSNRLIPRRVLEVYPENDLCLVEGLEGYEGLSLASSYEIGDLNYTVGYPLGQAMNLSSGYLKSENDVQILAEDVPLKDCKGPHKSVETLDTYFGSFNVCVITYKAVLTNIPTFPGNSGSPMVNAFGNVTGVVFAGDGRTNWGYSVPLEYVIDLLKAY